MFKFDTLLVKSTCMLQNSYMEGPGTATIKPAAYQKHQEEEDEKRKTTGVKSALSSPAEVKTA